MRTSSVYLSYFWMSIEWLIDTIVSKATYKARYTRQPIPNVLYSHCARLNNSCVNAHWCYTFVERHIRICLVLSHSLFQSFSFICSMKQQETISFRTPLFVLWGFQYTRDAHMPIKPLRGEQDTQSQGLPFSMTHPSTHPIPPVATQTHTSA